MNLQSWDGEGFFGLEKATAKKHRATEREKVALCFLIPHYLPVSHLSPAHFAPSGVVDRADVFVCDEV